MTYKEYNQIVDKYSDGLFSFALKMCKNKQDAEDIVQESFKRLWKNRKQVAISKAKSYLFTVAYHLFIDLTRSNSHYVKNEIFFNYQHSYTMKNPDLQDIINQAINRLPQKQKTVLLLRDYEGYSYKEIAEITGLNIGQVKVYIFRARQSVKKFIGKLENVI